MRAVKDSRQNICWFENWFDSPYYHLLYSNRDETEAERFIGKLIDFLKPKPGSFALDLACGKGRHAVAMHKLGLDVTGIDLSPKSIEAAKENEKDNLSFYIHDMREPFRINYFDFTFNLFTSFGYFNDKTENRSVIKSVSSGLKKNGIFVIDFLNANLVRQMVEQNNVGSIEKGGIKFNWKKKIENEVVLKHISFTSENKDFSFSEQVQLLSLDDFKQLLEPFFTIETIFGDYSLGNFDEKISPRLILIARKKQK